MSSYLDAENVMRTYQKGRKKKMEFSREKLRQIRRLMILAAFLILVILYSEKVFYGAAFLFGILKPFFYGGAIAFVLNIPMRGIENKWLGGWRGKASDKLKRPVSMVITLVPILGTSVGIGNTDAGIDPSFVNIKPTTDFTKDFKQKKIPPANICRAGRDWLSGEIESTSEEISLRATCLRQSLMP